MSSVRDKLWVWGHEAGSHNNRYGLKDLSRITPAEGAFYLNISNLIMVRYADKPAPPFLQHALPLTPLKRVVWSIVGAGGRTDTNEVDTVIDLARRFPNICGVIMDDFFKRKPDENGRIAVHLPNELNTLRKSLVVDNRKLDLWATLYQHNMNLPGLKEYLEECDVITYWTWRAEELNNLERNFSELKELIPSSRIVLGCYMWDFGDHRPIPLSLMQKQCQLGLKWIQEGHIEGLIFIATTICDLGLEAVEWTKRWIQDVEEQRH